MPETVPEAITESAEVIESVVTQEVIDNAMFMLGTLITISSICAILLVLIAGLQFGNILTRLWRI